MALQDQPQTPPSLLDPKTGQPYPFGSPEYEAAIAPWITGQIKSSAENAANARGMFYSGPAMADEIQAQQGALSAMAQQGAQQSLQEKELAQQEEFIREQQREQNQANADIANKNAKGALVSGALQGGTGALGTIGGMAAYSHFFGPKGTPTPVPAPTPVPGIGGGVAPIADVVSEANALPAGVSPSSMYASEFGATPGGPTPGLGAPAGPSPMAYGAGALASLPAAYFGGQAGERTFGHTPADKVASGFGGAIGGGLAGLAGPWAMPAGAALGSFLGPGIAEGTGQAANWLGARLGF